jgi:2-keto-4-pentenoate hydratase/2-oxohepta-3-ene-1,7-dioic acid hydratase in catechol pathway
VQLVTYQSDSGPRAAGIRDGAYVDLNGVDATLPVDLRELLAAGSQAVARTEAAIQSGQPIPADSVQLLTPIVEPGKIICVGLNYHEHAKESGMEPPPEPVIFSKFTSAVNAPGAPIVLPKVSDQVDYEAELVIVVGSGGRHIPREDALSRVAGYCCGHDVSARDWQLHKPGGQWLMGKTFDTFAPFGPMLVTADEVPDPNNLRIQLRLNGETMQDSTTAEFIFQVEDILAYVSQVCTLLPGDIIYTGTPSGVGAGRKPPVFLKDGDQVEVEIQGLGILTNPVVAEK